MFEAIERACRFRAVLPLSDGKGGLVLGGPSRSRTSVRLERGINILSASGTASWLARFSDYTLLGQQAGGAGGFTAEQVAHVSATARDGGIDRHRPLTIIGEQSLDETEAKARIQWEANVRSARARPVSACYGAGMARGSRRGSVGAGASRLPRRPMAGNSSGTTRVLDLAIAEFRRDADDA